MLPRTTLVLASIVFTFLTHASARAGDAEDGQRVHAAVLYLRDEVFNNCIAKMDLSTKIERNGTHTGREAGVLLFARTWECVLSDTAVTHTEIVRSDGRPRKDSHTYMQFFMAKGRRCIGIDYEPTKTGKRLLGLSCDPKRSYEISFLALTRYVRLSHVLSEFGPTGSTLVELTRVTPGSVKATKGGALTAVYPTVYGPLEVGVERVGGRDVVTTVRLAQSATDVYTSRSEGQKLQDIRDSILDDTPTGLTSVVTSFSFEYKDASGNRPFSSLTVSQAFSASGKEWRKTHTLRLTDYQKCSSEEKIVALRVPIPDGELVNSIDPEYHSITLAYRGGDVVRAVDGASLDEVVAEVRSRRIRLYVIISVIAAGLLVTIALLYARYRTRRSHP